jgi:hypothetical protein
MTDKDKAAEYARLMERLAQNLNRNATALRQALDARSSPVASALNELWDGLVDECPSDGPEFRRFFERLHAALSTAFLFGAAVEHERPFVSHISDSR